MQEVSANDHATQAGSIVDFTVTFYRNLLFGKGQQAWQKIGLQNFMLTVFPPDGTNFTDADLANCIKLLEGYNIKNPLGTIDNLAIGSKPMIFTIAAGDMASLCSQGLGDKDLGKLKTPSELTLESDAIVNNPTAVLHQLLRGNLLVRKAWTHEPANLLIGKKERYAQTLIIPAALLQLDRQNSAAERTAITQKITHALNQILPGNKIEISGVSPFKKNSESEPNSVAVAFEIAPENYANLVSAIEKLPTGKVTSITRHQGQGAQWKITH